MHKVDSAGATAQNEFTNGNLPGGIARTRLEAKFMNAVQRELVNLVIQAGLTLSDADDAQVLQSLPIVVPTIAALRLLPVPTVTDGKQVSAFVRGSATDGDDRAAFYRWTYNSTLTDDGLLVVRPSTNPAQGRWKLCKIGLADDAAKLGGNAAAQYALLNSPTFTGTPSGPTPSVNDNSTRFATTAHVVSKISQVINGAGAALDTLYELAAALGNDANFASTVTNALAAKAPLASPALTGTPTGPTAAVNTSTTQLATTAFANPGSADGNPGWYKNAAGWIEIFGAHYIGNAPAGDSYVQIWLPFAITAVRNVQLTVEDASGNSSFEVDLYSKTTSYIWVTIGETANETQDAWIHWRVTGY